MTIGRADKLGELWDVYDSKKHLTGRTHHRGDKLNDNDFHLVVNALIFKSADEILLQQRSFEKMSYPGMWTADTGGSVLAGETSEEAMVRELREELQLIVDADKLHFFVSRQYADWIEDWYVVRIDASVANLKRQESEVASLRWTTLSEAIKINNHNGFNDSELFLTAHSMLF